MINEQNWGFCEYRSGDFRANISIGADDLPAVEPQVIYFINKFQAENLIHQTSTADLDSAVNQINTRYQDWEFIDLEKKLHGSGCSTCQAH